jgi:hypothetical protein
MLYGYTVIRETDVANGFKMAEVSAHKAYLDATNLLTTIQHGAIPFPFKSNSKAWQSTHGVKSTPLWDRMFHFYMQHREEFLTYDH